MNFNDLMIPGIAGLNYEDYWGFPKDKVEKTKPVEPVARGRMRLSRGEFLLVAGAASAAALLPRPVDASSSARPDNMRARMEALGLSMVGIGEGFMVSSTLAAKVDWNQVERTDKTTIPQENAIKKGTETFLAKVGGNLTIDVAEATRPELRGQVQLIMPGVTQGNFTRPGIDVLDVPERGWMLLHSGTGGMVIQLGQDRFIQYPGGTEDHVISVYRGPYGRAAQDTNENWRAQIEVTDSTAGNVLWQRLMAPWEGNIGFVSLPWFAKEMANAHAASPNRGADGNSRVFVVMHDTNTGFVELLLNVQKRQDTLAKQIALSQDPASWTKVYSNAA